MRRKEGEGKWMESVEEERSVRCLGRTGYRQQRKRGRNEGDGERRRRRGGEWEGGK